MNDDKKATLDKLTLSAWDKHEKIAMHFNDLILKVRIQALGALAAIITVGVAIIHDKSCLTALPWGLIAVFFGILSVFWIAIWVLDFKYYNKLLEGAVAAILTLEDQMKKGEPIHIEMSHKIEAAVSGKLESRCYIGPTLFYLIVLFALEFCFIFSIYKVYSAH